MMYYQVRRIYLLGEKRDTIVSTVCRKMHIMSACPRALGATVGDTTRYWGRLLIQWTLQSVRTITDARPIYFIQASECAPSAYKINSCLLSTTQDWQWRVDIGNRLNVPEQIAAITLRPNLILWSTEKRQVLLIELTVPWEENIDVACERKLEKYQKLVEQCKVNKWRTACYPIEVGCRGFAGKSLCRFPSHLGIIGEKKRKAIRAIS